MIKKITETIKVTYTKVITKTYKFNPFLSKKTRDAIKIEEFRKTLDSMPNLKKIEVADDKKKALKEYKQEMTKLGFNTDDKGHVIEKKRVRKQPIKPVVKSISKGDKPTIEVE